MWSKCFLIFKNNRVTVTSTGKERNSHVFTIISWLLYFGRSHLILKHALGRFHCHTIVINLTLCWPPWFIVMRWSALEFFGPIQRDLSTCSYHRKRIFQTSKWFIMFNENYTKYLIRNILGSYIYSFCGNCFISLNLLSISYLIGFNK